MNSTDMDFNIFSQCFNTSLNLVVFYICSACNFMYIRYTYCTCIRFMCMYRRFNPRGGGGALSLYTGGVCRSTSKKMGLLGTGTKNGY